RGSGAVRDAYSTTGGRVKLVAMADIFEDRLKRSYEALQKELGEEMEVPEERRFLGMDAYKKAMDCLKPGDVAIFATFPAFRWVHFQYAIKKGINVFMEKPITVDGPSTRKMLALAEEADKKNLKVGVGLMVRHCRARQELHQRIQNGEIGDIILMRAYRIHPPYGGSFCGPKPPDQKELHYQLRKPHCFLWVSGGIFSDYNIHQIDECSWMKNAWPVKASAIGGRHYRGNNVDQNFDTYSVEYTYPDGTKLFFESCVMHGVKQKFCSFAHGTRGSAIISTAAHTPGKCRIFRGHNFDAEPAWAYPQPEVSPYKLEWQDLLDAIRNNQPYNEAKRGAIASLVTAMGRFAAHTGQEITYEEMLNHDHEFAPDVDKLTMDSPAPLQADADGKYPVPMPGITTKREY
ncbi:MAG: Gfo/Idh/MocA family oxidoreductase, partial [Verrucomicrobiae bacterium]|nr:Gfo/Idh/MocA family oxidoreductase [Verrucomicrobiae bacterium]